MNPDAISRLLDALDARGAQYVVIGSVALAAHGAPYGGDFPDLDLCVSRHAENCSRLAIALLPFGARCIGPDGMSPGCDWSAELARGLRCCWLHTALGRLDLTAYVDGAGFWPQVFAESEWVWLYGAPRRVLSLDALLCSKQIAGRPKDYAALAALAGAA